MRIGKELRRGFGKSIVVVLGALLITTLGVGAFDTYYVGTDGLVAQLLSGRSGAACPSGMVEVLTASTFRCIDSYEAAPGVACPHRSVRSAVQTRENLAAEGCQPVSVSGAEPWVHITRAEAAAACARSGKRLPDAGEWYQVALGLVNISDCLVRATGPQLTGTAPQCRTTDGVYDLVGNVWEWVADDVWAGSYNGRLLPAAGYVQSVDRDGMPVATAATPAVEFTGAYWYGAEGEATALLRGGFFGSGNDASIYTTHGNVTATTTTGGIGFRCVR